MATERPSYVPKMIEVSNLNMTLDEFKEKIANRVGVAQKGNMFYVFNSSKYQVEHIIKMFPAAVTNIIDSDPSIYQESIKIQSALNWTKFKTNNSDFVKDKEAKVYVIIKSSPFESRTEELATAFADKIATIAYQKNEEPFTFIVRPWIFDSFKAMQTGNTLLDHKKNPITNLVCYLNRAPMNRAIDKVIQVKFYTSVSQVDRIVKALDTFERIPNATFIEPSRLSEITASRKKFSGKARRDTRNNKRNTTRAQKGDNSDKPAYEKKERTERPKYTKEEKAAYKSKNSEKPAPKKQTKKDDIKISYADADEVSYFLNGLPETMNMAALQTSLRKAVDSPVTVQQKGKTVTCTASKSVQSTLESVLGRLKINDVVITYKKIVSK